MTAPANPTIIWSGWSACTIYGRNWATDDDGCSVNQKMLRTRDINAIMAYLAAMRFATFTQSAANPSPPPSRPLGLALVFLDVPRDIQTWRLQGSPPNKRPPTRTRSRYCKATMYPYLVRAWMLDQLISRLVHGGLFEVDTNFWVIWFY